MFFFSQATFRLCLSLLHKTKLFYVFLHLEKTLSFFFLLWPIWPCMIWPLRFHQRYLFLVSSLSTIQPLALFNFPKFPSPFLPLDLCTGCFLSLQGSSLADYPPQLQEASLASYRRQPLPCFLFLYYRTHDLLQSSCPSLKFIYLFICLLSVSMTKL